MEIKKSIENIENELKKARYFIEKSQSLKLKLDKKEEELKRLKANITAKSKEYSISPIEAREMANEAEKKQKKIIEEERELDKVKKEIDTEKSLLKKEHDQIKKEREDIKARFKDIEIMKNDIKNREINCIEREKEIKEKIDKLEILDNIK